MPRNSAHLGGLGGLLCAILRLLTLLHMAHAAGQCLADLSDGKACNVGDGCCGTCFRDACPRDASPAKCRDLCVGSANGMAAQHAVHHHGEASEFAVDSTVCEPLGWRCEQSEDCCDSPLCQQGV